MHVSASISVGCRQVIAQAWAQLVTGACVVIAFPCSLSTNTFATLSQCQISTTTCLPGYSCTTASLSNQANACAVGKYSTGGQTVRTPTQTRTCTSFHFDSKLSSMQSPAYAAAD